jgi:hypothetical protein
MGVEVPVARSAAVLAGMCAAGRESVRARAAPSAWHVQSQRWAGIATSP